ncbi:MAG: helix-turn-helix transcriptional regulator [Anaerolineae bacterium]|jgi:transcriptional regulator with XRE-family HTH domain
MKLGRRIRELREQMDLSQARLAGCAQVSQGYLCQLEREEVKNPSAAILLRLASALYVDPHELLDAAGYTPVRSVAGRASNNYQAKVDPDLLRFLAGLSQDQQRYILLLLESMGQRLDALPSQ